MTILTYGWISTISPNKIFIYTLKKYVRHINLISCLLIYFSCLGIAQKPLVLENEQLIYDANPYLRVLMDDEQQLSLADIVKTTAPFEKFHSPSIKMGYYEGNLWIKLQIQNNSSNEYKWLVELGYPQIDTVLFYTQENGVWRYQESGDLKPFSNRSINNRNPVFELGLAPNQQKVFYFKIVTTSSINADIKVYEIKAFQASDAKVSLAYGIYFGILAVMFFFNFFIFLTLKDLNYLYYTFSIICSMLVVGIASGFAYQYLYADYPSLNAFIVNMAVAALLVFVSLFTISFLELKTKIKPLFFIQSIIGIIAFVCLLLSPIVGYREMSKFLNLLVLFNSVSMLVCGITSWAKGNRYARFFTLSWMIYFMGGIGFVLQNLNLIPTTFFTTYGIEIGSAAEVVLLSFALADRINTFRMERKKAREKAFKIEKEYSEKLEKEVEERTKTIQMEQEKSRNLLLNILPQKTADELLETGQAIPRYYEATTVLFTDFIDFTAISKTLQHEELIHLLDQYFQQFDQILDDFGVEKIKTIGDAYLCVCGLPEPVANHAHQMVKAAFEMNAYIGKRKKEAIANNRIYFEARIGIHSGPLIGGIVGSKKFAYDIWGDTVNMASRMETASASGKVNISFSTYQLIKNDFKCSSRGKIKVKNVGEMEMFYVENA